MLTTVSNDTEFYVRGDGNNANSGTSNTPGGAWCDPQYAYDYIANKLFIEGAAKVTAKLNDGTFTSGVEAAARHQGPGQVVFKGNPSAPGNVIVTSPSNNGTFTSYNGAELTVQDMEIRNTGQHGLYAKWGGIIHHSNLRFGACVNGHMTSSFTGTIICDGGYSIVGDATRHVYAHHGTIRTEGVQVSLISTRTFNTFAYVPQGSFNYYGTTFSGSAIGKKFGCITGGLIQGDQDRNYLPGNIAGTCVDGGSYYGSEIITDEDVPWTSYTPTITASSGTPGSVSATGRYLKRGKTVKIQVQATIGSVGSATGNLNVSLPFPAASNRYLGTSLELMTGAAGWSLVNGVGAPSVVSARPITGGSFYWVNGWIVVICAEYEIA